MQVINASPGDLAPVFDAMLDRALRLCDGAFGFLSRVDGEELRAVALRNVPEKLAEHIRLPHRLDQVAVSAEVIRRGQVFQISDLADTDGYHQRRPITVASVEFGRVRSVLYVPLMKDERALGLIVIFRQEVRPFTDKQIALLQNFGAQAVIAIENTRLLDELQARTRDLEESLEYQTATSDVLKVISGSTFDIQPVFDMISATAARLCGNDTASIAMREGEVYRYVSAHALDEEYRAILRQRTVVPGRQSVTGRVALEGKVVQIADILADPDFALPETVAAGRRTILGVPLLRE